MRISGRRFIELAALVCSLAASAGAQTRIVAPPNKFTPDQDVQIGEKAAREAERQYPLLSDDAVTSYVQDVGGRLVDAIPAEFLHSQFRYTFKVLDIKDINAFALPGGPMYVHRGIIEAAHNEGELAGVMAHEMSHVALRHGTAQQTKAEKFNFGVLAGAIAGRVVGGGLGAAISEGSQFGIGATFLRFSREYEKQADLLGVQMLARAGYDPRDLAHMFETIEREGGNTPPQWLSDHPNPGNRVEYINAEASRLTIEQPIRASGAFARTQEHLKTLRPAKSLAEIAREQQARQRRR
jgi:predicted Zn-dependent protease